MTRATPLLFACTLSACTTLAAAQAPAPLPPLRGIYVNRFAGQSPKKMRSLIALADSTEINAFVIDIKDEFGINYVSTDTLVQRNAGRAGSIPDLAQLIDTLKAHHITPIARIVTFKDSVTARLNPRWRILQPDGSPWRDKKGITWVNPYSRDVWEYDLRVAEEAARLGFEEVQFDYVRFPEPYKSLPPQIFPGAQGVAKPEVLAEFLATARARVAKHGARTTADVFGLVTAGGTLEVGQRWENIAGAADVVLPMVYPSHYPHGSYGIARPNADPYKTIFAAVSDAHKRDMKLGIAGEHVRPWLQAFTLGAPAYGPAQLRDQKRAVYDAGYQGWVLWNPGSRYDAIAAGLDPKPRPAGGSSALAAKRSPLPPSVRQP